MKKIVSLMLAFLLVFSLAACSGANDTSAETGTEPAANDGTVSEETPAAADSADAPATDAVEPGALITKYDPPIEMHFGTGSDPNHAEMQALEDAFGETFEDNRWTRLYEEELGIKTVYDLIDPLQYDQALILAMSSNDLPDYFTTSNYSIMRNMADAGLLTEMGGIYEQYGSPLFKQITESEGEVVFTPGTFDGKLYGIPAKMPSTNDWVHMFIRQDWLDKLKLERPETMDDVMDVARAFKTQDPDENGVDDTFGMGFNNNFLFEAAGIFWAFGAYPNGTDKWIEKDGQLAFANVQPEMKDGLTWLNNMYNEGLFDPEFGALDYAKGIEEKVMSGKLGMFYAKHWNAYTLGQHMAEDANAKWVSIPLPNGTANEMMIPANVSTGGFTCVTAEAENPEAIVLMYNLYVDKLFGPDEEFDKYFADGDVAGIFNKGPINCLDPMLDLQGYRDIEAAAANDTFDQLTGSGAGFYNFYQNGSTYYWLMFGAGDSCFRFVNQTYPDQVIWNKYTGAPTDTMVERWSSMNELLLTSYTKMIQGQESLDNFDSIIEQWKSMGGDQVTAEVMEIVGWGQ